MDQKIFAIKSFGLAVSGPLLDVRVHESVDNSVCSYSDFQTGFVLQGLYFRYF